MLPIERCEQGQRLARRDLVLERGGLERGADPLLDVEGMLARVDAADLDAARVRLAQPMTHSSVVVLPAPFGPIRPKISPSSMSKLTPRAASTPSYRFRRSRTLTFADISE